MSGWAVSLEPRALAEEPEALLKLVHLKEFGQSCLDCSVSGPLLHSMRIGRTSSADSAPPRCGRPSHEKTQGKEEPQGAKAVDILSKCYLLPFPPILGTRRGSRRQCHLHSSCSTSMPFSKRRQDQEFHTSRAKAGSSPTCSACAAGDGPVDQHRSLLLGRPQGAAQ